MTRKRHRQAPRRSSSNYSGQHGTTLIELMIAVAIGLLLAVSASYMFVSSQRISRVVDSRAQQQETAAIVMDFIGRDLKNAGFYPASFPSSADTAGVLGGYTNVVDSTKVAFNQGLYGCSGAVFDTSTNTCPTAALTAPDSLVVNYFSSDDFTIDGVGTRRDCLKNSVDAVSYNVARAGSGATTTTTVALPVFVSNVYSLGAAKSVALDRQTISTRSFRCAGSGNAGVHQPLFQGVEELRILYGPAEANTVEAPARYYTATQMNTLSTAVINGETKTSWQRVVAVQVCIVTKTLDNNARQVASAGSYVNCDGTTVNYSTADRSLYQRDVRVFGLRNNLTATF